MVIGYHVACMILILIQKYKIGIRFFSFVDGDNVTESKSRIASVNVKD